MVDTEREGAKGMRKECREKERDMERKREREREIEKKNYIFMQAFCFRASFSMELMIREW